MRRRTEPTELVAARDLLRANHDAQQDATGAFFTAGARLAAVRHEAEALEADQQVHAGKLAALLGVDTAARVTGWSRRRLAEAQATYRSRRPSRPAFCDTADPEIITMPTLTPPTIRLTRGGPITRADARCPSPARVTSVVVRDVTGRGCDHGARADLAIRDSGPAGGRPPISIG